MQTAQVAQLVILERGVDLLHRAMLADLFDTSPADPKSPIQKQVSIPLVDKISMENFGNIY